MSQRMDQRMKNDLDNYITGHYGEDQFRDESDDESPDDKPNKAAMEAAKLIKNQLYRWTDTYLEDVAAIIEREMHFKEMKDALVAFKTAYEKSLQLEKTDVAYRMTCDVLSALNGETSHDNHEPE